MSIFNRYRTEIMGVGAVGVIIVHSSKFIHFSGAMKSLVSLGGSVFTFFFLSAVGLYMSMYKRQKETQNLIKGFYIKKI